MKKTDLPDDHRQSASGTLRSGHLLLIAALVVIVLGLVYYYATERGGDRSGTAPDGVAVVPEGSRTASLFFAEDENEALVTETRLVAIGKEFVEQVEQVIRALVAGPEVSGVSTIAEGTRLLNVFYDNENATVYLDFSSELVAGHPGGSSAEYFTIAAIVRTVSENFPEVRALQILVEGLQIGTIAGHIDAYEPFLVSDWR